METWLNRFVRVIPASGHAIVQQLRVENSYTSPQSRILKLLHNFSHRPCTSHALQPEKSPTRWKDEEFLNHFWVCCCAQPVVQCFTTSDGQETWYGLGWESQRRKTAEKQNGVRCICMSLDFFRSMQQFVSVAKQLWHEFDEIRNLRLSMELVEIKKQRIQTLQLWTEWEKELKSDERELHNGLHGKMANVLRQEAFTDWKTGDTYQLDWHASWTAGWI